MPIPWFKEILTKTEIPDQTVKDVVDVCNNLKFLAGLRCWPYYENTMCLEHFFGVVRSRAGGQGMTTSTSLAVIGKLKSAALVSLPDPEAAETVRKAAALAKDVGLQTVVSFEDEEDQDTQHTDLVFSTWYSGIVDRAWIRQQDAWPGDVLLRAANYESDHKRCHGSEAAAKVLLPLRQRLVLKEGGFLTIRQVLWSTYWVLSGPLIEPLMTSDPNPSGSGSKKRKSKNPVLNETGQTYPAKRTRVDASEPSQHDHADFNTTEDQASSRVHLRNDQLDVPEAWNPEAGVQRAKRSRWLRKKWMDALSKLNYSSSLALVEQCIHVLAIPFTRAIVHEVGRTLSAIEAPLKMRNNKFTELGRSALNCDSLAGDVCKVLTTIQDSKTAISLPQGINVPKKTPKARKSLVLMTQALIASGYKL